MTVTVIEQVESRETQIGSSNKSQIRVYHCTGADSPDAVIDIIGTDIPASIDAPDDGLVATWYARGKIVVPLDNDTYKATITYQPVSLRNPQVGDSSYSFDIGSQNVHIAQSISTISKTVVSGTAPDFQGAINVQADGTVDGADIIEPVYSFSETHWIADDGVTTSYKLDLLGVVGKVNKAAFRGHSAGEVLCTGISGRKMADGEKWEVTFSFSVRQNRTSITVGGITVAAKKGWEFLWVMYEKTVSNDRVVKQPVAAYVEQVYESADYGDLGI